MFIVFLSLVGSIQVDQFATSFELEGDTSITFSSTMVDCKAFIMFSQKMQNSESYVYDGVGDKAFFTNTGLSYKSIFFTINAEGAEVFIKNPSKKTYCQVWIEDKDKQNKCGDTVISLTGADYVYEELQITESEQVCMFMPTTITDKPTNVRFGYTFDIGSVSSLYYLDGGANARKDTTLEDTSDINGPFYLQFDTSNHRIFVEKKRDAAEVTDFEVCGKEYFLKYDQGTLKYNNSEPAYENNICTPYVSVWSRYKGLWITLIVVAVLVIAFIVMFYLLKKFNCYIFNEHIDSDDIEGKEKMTI